MLLFLLVVHPGEDRGNGHRTVRTGFRLQSSGFIHGNRLAEPGFIVLVGGVGAWSPLAGS